MKKIVTIYYADDWNKEVPITNIDTRLSFEDWHQKGLENGIEMFRSSIQWYDAARGVFTKAWAFRDGQWKKIEEEIKPDMIYDKLGGNRNHEFHDLKMKMAEKTKVFNTPLFQTLMNNKLNQSILLAEFMPLSFLALDEEEFINNLSRINSEKVVIKQFYGSGGFGVIIDEKSKIDSSELKYPVLVQEFIESNIGIPGFSPNGVVADLRLVYFNHKLSYALSRIAKEGSLFTNFHQGAKAVMVPEEKIPENVTVIAKKIIKKFSFFSEALYSIDFMFADDGKPYVIEINTTPGVDLLKKFGSSEQQEKFFRDFISLV